MSDNPTETNWRPAACRVWDPSPRGVDRCERAYYERRTWRRIPGCREIESLMVETLGAIEFAEKTDFLLEQFRLTMATNGYVRSELSSKKINIKKMKGNDDMQDAWIRYQKLLVGYNSHEK
eukprot:717029_1